MPSKMNKWVKWVKKLTIVKKIIEVLLRGNAHLCPFCCQSFNKFLTYGKNFKVISRLGIIGAGKRKNNLCPHCYSSDRERLVYLYLKYIHILDNNIKLLHVAPEKNLYSVFKSKKNITYLFGDIFSDMYTYPKGTIDLNIESMPFSSNTFDVIICNHVLEHVKDDKKALSEIKRTLKDGGFALLQVPIATKMRNTLYNSKITSKADREQYYGQGDHLRLYGLSYSKILEVAGFKVKMINPQNFLTSAEIDRYLVNRSENLYTVYKI